jgi:hypothetical protein
MTPNPTRREQIRDRLELLASEERQLTYERNVPHVDITGELICMWFNDLIYDLEDIRADASFSADERAALEQFHQFYDARVKQLPESQGTVRTWLASPAWREVMQSARTTLGRVAA